LEGKLCVITGANRGIGAATARLFASLGATVVATGRNIERGEALERDFGGKIKFKRVDLVSQDEIQSFFKWYDNQFMKVDVLINNAYTSVRTSVFETDLEDWEDVLAVNLTAPFLFSKWAAGNMIRNKIRGKIINISAVQAEFPVEKGFSYSVTKGGLVSMSKSMAVDLGPYGIQSIAVLPGPIYTEALGSSEEPPASLDARAATLLGRFGRKSEVAKVLAFLSSDDNTFITGSTILVDGGRMISRKPDPEEVSSEGLSSHSKPQ
jgi:NAD(P)-dependent dehydrogenase (short-subunit alcohol dehydrogenase family)